MTPEQLGFLVGAVIGGLVAGAICGILPLSLAIWKGRTFLGLASFATLFEVVCRSIVERNHLSFGETPAASPIKPNSDRMSSRHAIHCVIIRW